MNHKIFEQLNPEDAERIAAQFTNYIQKAVISAKIDYLRHREYINKHEEPTGELPERDYGRDALFEAIVRLEPLTADTLEQAATGEALFRALQNLSPVKKAALFYLIVEERDTKETAALLDKSLSRIYALRAILSKVFSES